MHTIALAMKTELKLQLSNSHLFSFSNILYLKSKVIVNSVNYSQFLASEYDHS